MASDLELATNKLAAWGVSLSSGNRLSAAVEHCRSVGASGEIARDPALLRLSLNALLDAHDFIDIASALPPVRVATLRKDLERAIQGTLDHAEADRPYLQLQAQHVVGAALTRAGIPTTHPTVGPSKGKRPDFLVENGSAVYGVEVKRPHSRSAIKDRLEEAREQLEDYGVSGAVLFDLTDCLKHTSPQEFMKDAGHLQTQLQRQIWTDLPRGFRPGYSGVMLLYVYARGAYDAPGDSNCIDLVGYTSGLNFTKAAGHILDHHALWLRRGLDNGLCNLGFTDAERAAQALAPPTGIAIDPSEWPSGV